MRLAQTRDGGAGLGHLHERKNSFLHARPPEAEKMRAGTRRSKARSKTRAIFSPTTDPMEPPINSKTKKPVSTAMFSMRPATEIRASTSPDALRVDFKRSLYFLESRKPGGRCSRRARRAR